MDGAAVAPAAVASAEADPGGDSAAPSARVIAARRVREAFRPVPLRERHPANAAGETVAGAGRRPVIINTPRHAILRREK